MLDDTSRRKLLTAAGGLAVGGIGISATSDLASADTTDETFTIMSGTDHETTGYVRTADVDGPTVMVVGGLHGSEQAGYEAAAALTEMAVEPGRLVVVPRANATAIEEGVRTGEDGVDLNRQFPVGETPTTELARALWAVVEEYEPDEFIDLHESIGIYDGDDVSDGAGQAIFHSRTPSARQEAASVVDYMNANHVSDPEYDFTIGPFSAEDGDLDGLFAHKVTRDTDARAFLVETYSVEPAFEQRVEWHTTIVQRLTRDELHDGGTGGGGTATEEPPQDDQPPEDEEPTEDEEPPQDEEPPEDEEPTEGEEPPQDDQPPEEEESPQEDRPSEDEESSEDENSPPVAEITADPSDAAERDFSKGQTVVLGASTSSDPDGEIASYAWKVGESSGFDRSGQTVKVSLDYCGEHPVTLRVRDDDGATATAEIVLSTV